MLHYLKNVQKRAFFGSFLFFFFVYILNTEFSPNTEKDRPGKALHLFTFDTVFLREFLLLRITNAKKKFRRSEKMKWYVIEGCIFSARILRDGLFQKKIVPHSYLHTSSQNSEPEM